MLTARSSIDCPHCAEHLHACVSEPAEARTSSGNGYVSDNAHQSDITFYCGLDDDYQIFVPYNGKDQNHVG